MWHRPLKTTAGRWNLRCSILCLILLAGTAGCLQYETVMYRSETRFTLQQGDVDINRPPVKDRVDTHDLVVRTRYRRYYVILPGWSVAAKINRKGVELASEGKFREAGIIFEQLVEEFPFEAAGYNNLGLVHEVAGNSKKAFTLLSKACTLEPGNYYYRKNFLYMHEKKK